MTIYSTSIYVTRWRRLALILPHIDLSFSSLPRITVLMAFTWARFPQRIPSPQKTWARTSLAKSPAGCANPIAKSKEDEPVARRNRRTNTRSHSAPTPQIPATKTRNDNLARAGEIKPWTSRTAMRTRRVIWASTQVSARLGDRNTTIMTSKWGASRIDSFKKRKEKSSPEAFTTTTTRNTLLSMSNQLTNYLLLIEVPLIQIFQ